MRNKHLKRFPLLENWTNLQSFVELRFEVIHVSENVEEHHNSFEVVVPNGLAHFRGDTFTLLATNLNSYV